MRLSGVGSRKGRSQGGPKIGAGFNVQNGSALIRARGPAHFLERGTNRHLVGVKRQRRGRKRKRLPVGGVVRTGPWMAGGNRGTEPFWGAVRASEKEMIGQWHTVHARAVLRAFVGR